MRFLSSLLGGVIVAIAAVLLTLFALENTQVVSLSFLGMHFSGNIWWLVLGAAAIGFVLAMLLLVPGRMVTTHRAYNLSQLNARHEQDLADLRNTHMQLQTERDHLTAEHARMANEGHTLRDELSAARADRDVARRERDQLRAEREQLRDERERMTAERDQLRERLAAIPAVAPVDASGYRPTVEPALMGVATPGAPARADREDHVLAGTAQEQTPGEPVMPPAEPAAATSAQESQREDQVVAREPVVTQPARPSLGERVRAAVTGRPVEEVQAQDQAKNDELTDQPQESPTAEQDAAPSDAMSDARAEATTEPATTETATSEAMADGTDATAASADTTDQSAPTLGERVRAVFTGQPVDEVRAEYARGDEAPATGDEPPMPGARPASAAASMASPAETSEEAPAEAAATNRAPEPDQPMPAPEPEMTTPADASAANEPTRANAAPADTQAPDDITAAAPAPEPEEIAQPTLGDRLRAMFHQPESAPEGEETPPPDQSADQTSQQPTA